jgi:hypothetical protein
MTWGKKDPTTFDLLKLKDRSTKIHDFLADHISARDTFAYKFSRLWLNPFRSLARRQRKNRNYFWMSA